MSLSQRLACAIDSIILAQKALAERTDTSGVRQWSNACRRWVECNRGALVAAVAARSDRAEPHSVDLESGPHPV